MKTPEHITDPIVIVGMARTPTGNLLGSLKEVTAPELGATAIKAALQRAKVTADNIDEVYMGCVLPAGQGQAPARQASLLAGIPVKTGCTTINKMCGSGMKSVMLAIDSIIAGTNKIVVAGGMESMTHTPYLLKKARGGYRLGHDKVYDHMFLDGLEDAYEKGKLMGIFAEEAAEKYGFTRNMQDEYAIASFERAKHAAENGLFADEITPVIYKDRRGEHVVDKDEGPQTVNIEKIPTLKPAFKENGTVTAANSSSISDGAAALVVMRQSTAKELHLNPLAVIHCHTTFARAPSEFTIAPIGAINALQTKLNWATKDVDLYEINEAFAVVVLKAMQDLNLNHDKVNIHGGACILGHPIGASGARILVTLISALRTHKLTRGIAALCIGGGEATAVGVEIQD